MVSVVGDLWTLPFFAAAFLIVIRTAPVRVASMLVVLTALVVRVAYLLIDSAFGPIVPYDSDWNVLHSRALSVLDEGVVPAFTTGREFFGWVVGAVWTMTGPTVAVVSAMNVMIGTGIVYLTYRFAFELWGSWQRATMAALIASLFPTLIVYAAQPSREPMVALLALASMFYAARWFRTRSIRYLIAAFGSLTFAAVIHSAFAVVAVALAAVVAFDALRPRLRYARSELAANLLAGAVVACAGAAVLWAGIGLDKAGNQAARLVSFEQLQRVTVVGDIDKRTAYVTRDEIEVHSVWDVIVRYPRRLALFLFKPFPSDVREASDAIGLIVVIFGMVALLRLLRSYRTVRRNPGGHLSLLALVVTVLLFAWGTVNYGTATRHKSKLVPIVAALVVAPRRPEPQRS